MLKSRTANSNIYGNSNSVCTDFFFPLGNKTFSCFIAYYNVLLYSEYCVQKNTIKHFNLFQFICQRMQAIIPI